MTTDLDLFAWVVAHVHAGGSYYAVMGDALRHGPGPAGSLFHWRPPLVYLLLALSPWPIPASAWPLLLTDVWAGIAILASSLTARSRPWVSIALAGFALLCRELALPYVLLRAVLDDGRHRKAWVILAVVVTAYYADHWLLVSAYQLDTDTPGPGWLAFGGFQFLRATVTPNPLTLLLGEYWGAWLWLAALVGCVASPRLPLDMRLTLAGYGLAFLVVGQYDPPRANHAYWGFVVLPMQGVALWKAGISLLDMACNIRLTADARIS